jgi:signal transduction histidine kinase
MAGTENPEALFIAKITASSTHELRNVLAIVKESAGLVGDMLEAAARGKPLKHDRIARAMGKIDAQVDRGAALLTNLNRFAHSTDRPTERVDLNEEADQVATLCERFARLKGHVVAVEQAEEPLPVDANALHLHMAFCGAVECCLDRMEEPGTIRVRALRSIDGPGIELTGEVQGKAAPSSPRAAPGWPAVEKVLEQLAARAEPSENECHVSILLPGT